MTTEADRLAQIKDRLTSPRVDPGYAADVAWLLDQLDQADQRLVLVEQGHDCDRDLLDLATRFTLRAVPEDAIPDYHHWQIHVEDRGNGRWAVVHHGFCLGRDGQWDHEPSPSNRQDDWLAGHRFDRDEALHRAWTALSTLRINGLSAADVLARHGTGR